MYYSRAFSFCILLVNHQSSNLKDLVMAEKLRTEWMRTEEWLVINKTANWVQYLNNYHNHFTGGEILIMLLVA